MLPKPHSYKDQLGIRTRETSLAKWQAYNFANKTADDAVQVYGAHGYSDEYPVA